MSIIIDALRGKTIGHGSSSGKIAPSRHGCKVSPKNRKILAIYSCKKGVHKLKYD